jgi:hypothetical protein
MSTILSRRDFIGAVGALAAAGLALAQPSVRLYRIGILSQAWSRERLSALLNALSELGYVEGRNTRFDIQYANGRTDLLASLADERRGLIEAIGNPKPCGEAPLVDSDRYGGRPAPVETGDRPRSQAAAT